MRSRMELRPEALADLDGAAAWYEQQRAGLGRDFVKEAIAAINSLPPAPLLPRLRHRTAGFRWIYPKRFPYRIIYRVENDAVVILAIMHAARSDDGWRSSK